MSCGGGHLGFPIGIKNSNLVKDIPMIIHLQFGFSQFISFREEDLWNFSQSEHIIGPGSNVEYPTGTKNSNFVEDHPRNIPAKFGSNWHSGFRRRSLKCEKFTDDRQRTTDDGRQVMAIIHMDLWSRWTKKVLKNTLLTNNHSPYMCANLHRNASNIYKLKYCPASKNCTSRTDLFTMAFWHDFTGHTLERWMHVFWMHVK